MGPDEKLGRRVKGLLARIGEGADVHGTLDEVLGALSEASGCESVGIRWKAGEDYPYLLTRGFGRDFVVVEGPLCVRDAAGLILRHRDGRPQLACMCGAVVQGRTDPSLPYFSKGGSFWTSGTSRLLAETGPGKQTGVTTRNYCNQVGYESVALVPLRSGGKTYGVLQMNSRTPGRFTEQSIAAYEGLAGEIAAAVAGRVDETEGRSPLG